MKKILIKILFCCFWLSSYGQFEPYLDLGVAMNSRHNKDNPGRAGGGEIWAVYPRFGAGVGYYFKNRRSAFSKNGVNIGISFSQFKDYPKLVERPEFEGSGVDKGQRETNAMITKLGYIHHLNIKNAKLYINPAYVFGRFIVEEGPFRSIQPRSRLRHFGLSAAIGTEFNLYSRSAVLMLNYTRLTWGIFRPFEKVPVLEIAALDFQINLFRNEH